LLPFGLGVLWVQLSGWMALMGWWADWRLTGSDKVEADVDEPFDFNDQKACILI
jgi:hypothetical protein